MNKPPLDAETTSAIPGFTEQVAGISGDFDENGLTDEAMILSSGSEWRLAVLFQQPNGFYDITRVTTFPGSDDGWYAIPTSNLQLFLVTGDDSPIDRIGLQATQHEYSLEFFWDEKTGNFLAIRVHSETAPQLPDIASSPNRGETTLEGVDPSTDSQPIAEVDLDPQTDVKPAMADLKFTAGGGSIIFYTLDPIGQAVAVPYGKSPPTHSDCLAAVASMSTDNMPEVEQGMYFCVKTDQNVLASVWVQSLDATSNRLSLGYQRWPEAHDSTNNGTEE